MSNVSIYDDIFTKLIKGKYKKSKLIKLADASIISKDLKSCGSLKAGEKVREISEYKTRGNQDIIDIDGYAFTRGAGRIIKRAVGANEGILRSIKKYTTAHTWGIPRHSKISDYNTYINDSKQYSLNCKIYNTHVICELKDKIFNSEFSISIDMDDKISRLSLTSFNINKDHVLYSEYGLELIDAHLEYDSLNGSNIYSAAFDSDSYSLYKIESVEIEELIRQFKKDDFKSTKLLQKVRDLNRHILAAASMKSIKVIEQVIKVCKESYIMNNGDADEYIQYYIFDIKFAPHRVGDEFHFGEHILQNAKNFYALSVHEWKCKNYESEAHVNDHSGKNIFFTRKISAYILPSKRSNYGYDEDTKELREIHPELLITLANSQYFFNQDYSEFTMDKFEITNNMASTVIGYNFDDTSLVFLRSSTLFDDEGGLVTKSLYDVDGNLTLFSSKIQFDNKQRIRSGKEIVVTDEEIIIRSTGDYPLTSKLNKVESEAYKIRLTDENVRKLQAIVNA